MWLFDTQYSISYRYSTVTDSVAVFEIYGPENIGVTTLTFQGYVTSSVTWRSDSPYAVSYWCSIGTKPLSPSLFEIFGSKYIGVTNLTFQGHLKSLGMWPFDTPYSISYTHSIVTDSLSPAVFYQRVSIASYANTGIARAEMSVCPSVCPSHSGIVSKRRELAS